MSNYNGSGCGRVIAALGLAALTGAAINQGINDRRQEREKIAERQRKLCDVVEDQQRELDRLRRETNRISDDMKGKS